MMDDECRKVVHHSSLITHHSSFSLSFIIHMHRSRPRIILCESGVRWAAAWRRCASAPTVDAVSALSACETLMNAAPQSFVLLEVDQSRMPQCMEWITRCKLEHPSVAIAVVGDNQIEAWRAVFLERGALLVVTSERRLNSACAAARRHLARWEPPELGLRERVWAGLPWA